MWWNLTVKKRRYNLTEPYIDKFEALINEMKV